MKPDKSLPQSLLASMLFPLTSKKVLYIFIALLFASVLIFTEWPLLSVDNAAHKRMFTMTWLLVPHILCGLAAFLIAPFQFSTRLRNRNLSLHRMLGKIYVVAVLVAAILAAIINHVFATPGTSSIFLYTVDTQAFLWFITTLIGYLTVRNKQIILHKIWMSRSYGITLIFVLSRVLNPFPAYGALSVNAFSFFLWLLMIFALIVPEVLLYWNEIFVRKKKL